MANKRDYYEILSVSQRADKDELKRAYRKLAMKYHPDRNPDDSEAEERFKEATEAYSVLSDDQKRATYDQFGHEGLSGAGVGTGFGFEDIFSQFSDIFGLGGFGDLFGRKRRRGPAPGASVSIELTIEFLEAMHGAEKVIEVPINKRCDHCEGKGAEPGSDIVRCPICNGRGQVHHTQGFFSVATTCPKCRGQGQVVEEPCAQCRGKGVEESTHEVKLVIPPGVDTGTRLRLRGQGDASTSGGPRGDLYVDLNVLPSDMFERRGPHLITEVPISFVQAALGCEVEIPTIDGSKSYTIKPGTQPGTQVMFKGDGVPDRRGYGNGDLVAIIAVEIPTELDSKERELLEAYAEHSGVEVKKGKAGLFDRLRSKG